MHCRHDPTRGDIGIELALEAANYTRAFKEGRRGLREPELKLLQRSLRRDHLVLEDADPNQLTSAGWGVIFCDGEDAEIRERLEPLLKHRREQAGSLYQELVVRPGETSLTFRANHEMAPDSIDPHKIPYYLLIAAPPSKVSFKFQQELGIQHAVGRLAFDDPSRYENYARSVVESDLRPTADQVAFFGVRQDRVTRWVHEELLERWISEMHLPEPWTLRQLMYGHATKKALSELLSGAGAESSGSSVLRFLVAAAHGLNTNPKWPVAKARSQQGALVCERRPGEPLGLQNCFTGIDVDPRADLTGLLLLLIVCFGAGTSAEFWKRRGSDAGGGVSSLAQALLGNPGGGASALLGQVDRQWTYTFQWPIIHQHVRIQAYRRFLEKLLCGDTVGMAMEPFRQRTIALSLSVIESVTDEDPEVLETEPELLPVPELWKSFLDAKNQVLIGDPAVRLAQSTLSSKSI